MRRTANVVILMLRLKPCKSKIHIQDKKVLEITYLNLTHM